MYTLILVCQASLLALPASVGGLPSGLLQQCFSTHFIVFCFGQIKSAKCALVIVNFHYHGNHFFPHL